VRLLGVKEIALLLVLVVPLILMLAGCSLGISKEDAIAIGRETVSAQTKFYTKVGNVTRTISNISITSESAYRDGDVWNVVFHVQGTDELGDIRQNDVVVVLNKQGDITGVGSGKIEK
jgi:hypothetical protein